MSAVFKLEIRIDAGVLEVADTAYKLRFAERQIGGNDDIGWVHKFIITDVLGPSVSVQITLMFSRSRRLTLQLIATDAGLGCNILLSGFYERYRYRATVG